MLVTIFTLIVMQVLISSKTIPPGHDSKGQKPCPRDNHCVQNPSPRDKTGSQKPHPLDIKLENFTNVSINRLTLFEMKSFVVSTNKTVFQ